MKLPNGDGAIVDIEKLNSYCLNLHHMLERNKARVFASVGIRQADAESLRAAILQAAIKWEARPGVLNSYGQRYSIFATVDQLICIMKERLPMDEIEIHSVVALLEDLPEHDSTCGHAGTVVEL